MQNNNERGVLFSINDQHTSGDNNNKNSVEIHNMEYPIHQMVIPENQKGQLENSGFGNGDISNSQNSQQNIPQELNLNYNFIISHNNPQGHILGSTNAMMNGICYSMEKSTKLYSDKLLEEINLSDDEEVAKNLNNNNNKNERGMGEVEYNNQMDKINEFYDEFADGSMNKYTGTKNELEERVNIPVPFEIDSNTVFTEAGIVDSIFENDKILLKPILQNGILDLDNIIWNSNHIAVGYLDDVLGKIDEPVYVIKFFPNLTDKNLVVQGEPLFYVKDKAQKVEKRELLRKKGCDASNAFDEEVSDSGREFSDDEEEYHYKQMKRKNRNNFGKRKIEESRGEFIIPSGPVKKGIDNLKSKYFAETSYENPYSGGMDTDDFNIPVKKQINNPNKNSIPQSFYSNNFGAPMNMQNQSNVNQNPHFSAEYKLSSSNHNNNIYQPNNAPNNSYSGFNNMISFGAYNPVGMGNMPAINNVSNFIRPMGINPFAPPTFSNNPNLNFGFNNTNIPGSSGNSIFHSNHNIFNNSSNQNENNHNQQN